MFSFKSSISNPLLVSRSLYSWDMAVLIWLMKIRRFWPTQWSPDQTESDHERWFLMYLTHIWEYAQIIRISTHWFFQVYAFAWGARLNRVNNNYLFSTIFLVVVLKHFLTRVIFPCGRQFRIVWLYCTFPWNLQFTPRINFQKIRGKKKCHTNKVVT